MTPEGERSAGVRVDPQLIYLVPLVVALLVHRWRPLRGLDGWLAAVAGVASIGLGVALGYHAVRGFRTAGTSIQPWDPSTALVTSGVYRFSRNPIYLCYTLVYLGIGLWLGTLWHVVLLPGVIVTMNRAVIAREERYLASRFGDDYREYRNRVRRWL